MSTNRSTRERGRRAFRALLRLLPFEFRDSYGREMWRTFADQRREAAREGTMSIFRLWIETIRGLLTTAPGQHLAILRQDIGYALRMMRKHRGFTAVALLTLVIAIAANTAIFSIVHTVLLKPYPYADPDRLVLLFERNLTRGENRSNVSPPNFLDWREANRTAPDAAFTQMAAVVEAALTIPDQAGRGPTRVRGFMVTAEFFEMLGVPPQYGRGFTPDDEHLAADAARPIVLSHGFWQRVYGGDPGVIGRTVQLDERPYTVVGVLPAWFRFRERGDVFVPLAFSAEERSPEMRGARYLDVMARIKPGLTLAQADDRLGRLVQGLAQQRKTRADWGTTVLPLREVVSRFRASLWLLMGAVGFVLLIACANLASLLLARTVSRREEMAVRAALGAGHARLFRQLLTESLVLGAIAGVLGVIVASLAITPLAQHAPGNLPRLEEVGLDWPVLLFTLGISLLTGLLFGLAPALRVSASNLFDVLRTAGRGAGSGRRSRVLRDPLVATQVGLTLMLLLGATLMARSFIALQHVSLGFTPTNVMTHFVSAPGNRFRTPDQWRAFTEQVLQGAAAVPGVMSAALDVNVPLSGSQMMFGFTIDAHVQAPGERMTSQFHVIAGDYFRTLGQPVLSGRVFDARESPASPKTVIINETMARRYWPNRSPLGEHVTLNALSREIVGVVADIKHDNLIAAALPEVYVPASQNPWQFTNLIVRTDDGHAAALPAAVREAMARLDPLVPFDHFVWMDDLVAESLAPVRFLMLLLGFFALIALLLSAVCIYGVMSYAVSLRANELGVRIALGAAPRDLVWLVVREAMAPALVGTLVGLAIAVNVAHALRAQFAVINTTDPATLAIVTIVLIGVALMACYLPARRATKVDPIITLRAS
jgi:putative ABC transport system permease protein